MTTKKRQKTATSKPISDKSYIQSGYARKLPVHSCRINQNWRETGMAQVIVCRQHITGFITGAFYLVDLFCTGVKDTFFFFNKPKETLDKFIDKFIEQGIHVETCAYTLAHNIIYSGLEFAGECGIEPLADFAITKMILEEDDEKIELIDIECGKDGKPFLVSGSADPRTNYYLGQLKKYAGEGNYHFMAESGR